MLDELYYVIKELTLEVCLRLSHEDSYEYHNELVIIFILITTYQVQTMGKVMFYDDFGTLMKCVEDK